MFTEKHYVPVLKGKAGEYRALSELSLRSSQSITPLIEIPPLPFDYETEEFTKTMSEHLSSTLENIKNSWGSDLPIFIDYHTIDNNDLLTGGIHPIIWLTNELIAAGYQPIPVLYLDELTTVKQYIRTNAVSLSDGICLRLKSKDWGNPQFAILINNILNDLSLPPSDIHLIIDLEYIYPPQSSTYRLLAQTLINTTIPNINNWKTVTLVGSSFPIDLSGLERNNISDVYRHEWLNWLSLFQNQASLKRMPSFGDYGISHPEIPDLDPRFITPSASVRYTISDRWLVFKGISLRNSRVRFSQFHSLADDIRTHPDYFGRGFSFGDNYIYECADRTTNSGNLTTWRAVGTNHHIEVVVNQISNLP